MSETPRRPAFGDRWTDNDPRAKRTVVVQAVDAGTHGFVTIRAEPRPGVPHPPTTRVRYAAFVRRFTLAEPRP